MSKQIAIYGAFDRFNYGDLLFAVILEKIFRESEGYEIVCYALQESDLSRHGGIPTRSIQALFRKGNLTDGSIVILAGGEVLGATWFKLHRYILPQIWSFPLRIANRLISASILDRISRRAFRSRLTMPYVITPQDFPANVLVAYNAVGGSSLKSFDSELQAMVGKKLKQASYVSLRDSESISLIKEVSGIDADLAPDSAVQMSALFPKERLMKMVSKEADRIMGRFSGGYFCFQASDDHARDHIPVIVQQLRQVSKNHDLGIVLLPIGTASGHEDQIPLGQINTMLDVAVEIHSEANIFDIMALIANARVFAGTSLHGNITAMSFSVPYIGLTDKVPKLEAYLRTWAVPELNHCIAYDDLSMAVRGALNVPEDKMFRRKNHFVSVSQESMKQMKKALGLKEAS